MAEPAVWSHRPPRRYRSPGPGRSPDHHAGARRAHHRHDRAAHRPGQGSRQDPGAQARGRRPQQRQGRPLAGVARSRSAAGALATQLPAGVWPAHRRADRRPGRTRLPARQGKAEPRAGCRASRIRLRPQGQRRTPRVAGRTPRTATELAAHYGVTLSAISQRISRAQKAGQAVPHPIETEDGRRYDPKAFDAFWNPRPPSNTRNATTALPTITVGSAVVVPLHPSAAHQHRAPSAHPFVASPGRAPPEPATAPTGSAGAGTSSGAAAATLCSSACGFLPPAASARIARTSASVSPVSSAI